MPRLACRHIAHMSACPLASLGARGANRLVSGWGGAIFSNMKRAAPIFAGVALLDGCFPDFSGLTGASPDDASNEGIRLSLDADAPAHRTPCHALAPPTPDPPLHP